MNTDSEKNNPFEQGEDTGNIWGWRFSLFGLALILLLLGVIVYRHYTMGVPPGFEDPMKMEEPADNSPPQDTLTQ